MADPKALIARIRDALGRTDVHDDADSAPPDIDESLVRRVRADADGAERVDGFAAAARAGGATCTVLDLDDLGRALLAHLAPGAKVVLGITDDSLAAVVRDAMATAGTVEIDWATQPRLEAHHDADLGITDVEAAVAETGSLLISGLRGRSRGTWLVPPLHIAIVAASRIVADMLDLTSARIAPGGPSYRVLVTGPSKTADIEGELVTGVHGPGAVHVLVVRDR